MFDIQDIDFTNARLTLLINGEQVIVGWTEFERVWWKYMDLRKKTHRAGSPGGWKMLGVPGPHPDLRV
jgi:hypothetical protein